MEITPTPADELGQDALTAASAAVGAYKTAADAGLSSEACDDLARAAMEYVLDGMEHVRSHALHAPPLRGAHVHAVELAEMPAELAKALRDALADDAEQNERPANTMRTGRQFPPGHPLHREPRRKLPKDGDE